MTEMTIEQRLAALEHQLLTAQTAGLMALRMWFDDLCVRIDRGELTIEQAQIRLLAAAEQVGEGAPHLAVDALNVARIYCDRLATGSGGG